MGRSKKITVAVMAICAAALIGWDIVVAANDTPGDTISEITLAFAMRHPVIPFAVGVLMGHLWWAQKPKE